MLKKRQEPQNLRTAKPEKDKLFEETTYFGKTTRTRQDWIKRMHRQIHSRKRHELVTPIKTT